MSLRATATSGDEGGVASVVVVRGGSSEIPITVNFGIDRFSTARVPVTRELTIVFCVVAAE